MYPGIDPEFDTYVSLHHIAIPYVMTCKVNVVFNAQYIEHLPEVHKMETFGR